MKATDWAHFPDDGGYLDQDHFLMDEVMTIQWRYDIVKQHLKLNEQQS